LNTITQEQKFELQNQDLAFNFTLIEELIQQREKNLEHLIAAQDHLSKMTASSKLGDLFFNFVQCYGTHDLVDQETGTKRLDKGYWKKLIESFNFEKLVSIAELKNIRHEIQNMNTPAFTKENVESFIYNLWSDRYLIFARKVDSALQNLSADYKTNVNHLFTGKLIVPNTHRTTGINMVQCRHIDEIRQAIRSKMGLCEEFIPTYNLLLNWDFAELDWLDIDFDLLRIKKYKNNSLHIQLSADLVQHFNDVLAYIHKNRLSKDSLDRKAKPYERKRKFQEFAASDLPILETIYSRIHTIQDGKFKIPNSSVHDILSTLFKLDNILEFDEAKKSLLPLDEIEITLKDIKAKQLLWIICDGGIEVKP